MGYREQFTLCKIAAL